MKKRSVRIISFLLCASLFFAVPVNANPETEIENAVSTASEAIETDGQTVEEPKAMPEVSCTDTDGSGRYIQVVLENYEKPDNVTGIQFAVWSEAGGQDDLRWYNAEKNSNGEYYYLINIGVHNDTLGKYQVHTYAKKADGTLQGILVSSFTVDRISRPDPVVQVKEQVTEESYEITVSDFDMPAYGEKVMVAIWSEAGGQDDLIWSDMKLSSDGIYRYQCNISDHRTAGTYKADVYLRHKDGTMQRLGGTNFEITALSCQNVEIQDVNTENGTCIIVIKGINSPSGIAKVQVPVWSRIDQSDLIWYTAQAREDGNYQISFNIADHGYHIGTYQIHVYVTGRNQVFANVFQTSMTFEGTKAVVSSDLNVDKATLRAENVMLPGGVNKVLFAVWSEENGQDDLRWNYANYNQTEQSGQYVINLKDYKGFGLYHVDAYAQGPTGEMVFLGKADFIVDKPSAGNISIVTDNAKGSFQITIEDVKCATGVKEVLVPVWSTADQSDLVWYTATKNSAGNYEIVSDISKHQYHVGKYTAHVYIKDQNNLMANVASGAFEYVSSVGNIQLEQDTKETSYHLSVDDVCIPGGVKKIMVAVWSEENGQDDLYWYTAQKESASSYSVNINIKKHATLGQYAIHVYGVNQKDQMIGLGTNSELKVTSTAKAAVEVAEVNETKGTFKVKVTVSNAVSGISLVRVPVWSTADQSDLVWYVAQKQSDGSYIVTVDVSRHKYNLGTYKINVYVTMGNGIFIGAGSSTYEFNPNNFLCVINDIGKGQRRAVLKNVSQTAQKVQFPVWSSTNGQDDLVWYEASKNSAGDWEAVIQAQKHKSPGEYIIHAYVDGRGVRTGSFEFTTEELGKNGWYYENGYKLYYQNNELVTDVSSIIGPQSEYMAKVNRVTCTVTIYAKDGNNGFIIPVKVFACSVGLPGTETPLGTYHTLAKYRWHELMGPSYGQYCTRIVGGILFHSVAGSNMTSYNLPASEYNKLGSPASHGCVRLNVRDAKWIYDNCKLGMTVVIYDSSDPGPLGKPATIKIPANQNWDPTDPNI